MSEAKFTKGEWLAWDERVGIIDESDSQANGMMMEVAYIEKYDFPDEYMANAHLIAAAPEMYKEIKRDIESLHCKLIDAITIGESSSIKHDIERKSKLLAKARGDI